MRIEFKGLHDVDISPRFETYARPRLEGLAHFSEQLKEAKVIVERERGLYTVEITCDVNGLVLRAETKNHDQLAAFDEALDRVERQIVRWKQKLVKRRRRAGQRGAAVLAENAEQEADIAQTASEEEAAEENEEFPIVRVKAHMLKPMSPQEAVLQMELLGHDFFVFYNDEEERVEVVYRRKQGGYGLIEPEIGE